MTDRTERRARLPSASLFKAFDNIDRSRKDAIKIFCIECVGGAPGYRGEVRDCTDWGCSLHPWRPYKPGEIDESSDGVEKDKLVSVEAVVETTKKKKKKKCCDNPAVMKSENGRRECKNCGKKWKLKKKEV